MDVKLLTVVGRRVGTWLSRLVEVEAVSLI